MEHDQFLKEINSMLRPIKLQLSFITFLSVVAVIAQERFFDLDNEIWGFARPTVWVILIAVCCFALIKAGVFVLQYFFSKED